MTERRNNYLSLTGTTKDNFNFIKTTEIAFNEFAVFWDTITLTPKEESVVAALQILEPDVERISLSARWQSIKDKLSSIGYRDIPQSPLPEGWVCAPSDPYLPRVGVWLMPNNQLPEMLEDFVAHLIPAGDSLYPKAEAILEEIEQAGLNRYTLIHHPKALIHTWLAWQTKPAMPMGQAITAQVLNSDRPIALIFIEWLKHLFQLVS